MGKYFTVRELCASSVASARGIDNTPSPEAVVRLEALIENLLDPLRKLWGGPVGVNSGYRSQALNRAVGGAPHSQHIKGEAADITVGSRDANRKLFEIILKSGLQFDQLIDESGYSWLHVSWTASPRRQVLHL